MQLRVALGRPQGRNTLELLTFGSVRLLRVSLLAEKFLRAKLLLSEVLLSFPEHSPVTWLQTRSRPRLKAPPFRNISMSRWHATYAVSHLPALSDCLAENWERQDFRLFGLSSTLEGFSEDQVNRFLEIRELMLFKAEIGESLIWVAEQEENVEGISVLFDASLLENVQLQLERLRAQVTF